MSPKSKVKDWLTKSESGSPELAKDMRNSYAKNLKVFLN